MFKNKMIIVAFFLFLCSYKPFQKNMFIGKWKLKSITFIKKDYIFKHSELSETYKKHYLEFSDSIYKVVDYNFLNGSFHRSVSTYKYKKPITFLAPKMPLKTFVVIKITDDILVTQKDDIRYEYFRVIEK